LGGLLALWILGQVVRVAWAEARAQAISVETQVVFLAFLALTGAYFAMVEFWRLVLVQLGARVRFGEALQLWSFSNLGRYLPGKFWQVAGLMMVARDLGVSSGIAATAGFVALGLTIGTGSILALLLAPDLGDQGLERAVKPLALALTAGGLLVIVFPGLLSGFIRRLPPFLGCANVPPPSRLRLLGLVACFALGWIAQGAAFYLFASAFGDLPLRHLPSFAGAYALAHVGGLVAIFAPGGIGVRESLLSLLLGRLDVPGLPAHACAVGARLWTVGAELLLLASAIALRVFSRRSS
jgi:hypothetical protein